MDMPCIFFYHIAQGRRQRGCVCLTGTAFFSRARILNHAAISPIRTKILSWTRRAGFTPLPGSRQRKPVSFMRPEPMGRVLHAFIWSRVYWRHIKAGRIVSGFSCRPMWKVPANAFAYRGNRRAWRRWDGLQNTLPNVFRKGKAPQPLRCSSSPPCSFLKNTPAHG
jgi:hypothetical protein